MNMLNIIPGGGRGHCPGHSDEIPLDHQQHPPSYARCVRHINNSYGDLGYQGCLPFTECDKRRKIMARGRSSRSNKCGMKNPDKCQLVLRRLSNGTITWIPIPTRQ